MPVTKLVALVADHHADGELTCRPCLPIALPRLTILGRHHRGQAYNLQWDRHGDGTVAAQWFPQACSDGRDPAEA